MTTVQLMTLDPGHFHAALVQKEMIAGISPKVHIYAPLGPDLLAHLIRIVSFNSRAANPTAWELEVHAGPDFRERMMSERPGNVVVLSGGNRDKIRYIEEAVAHGLNVLADKPWIINAVELPRLEAALNMADEKGLIAYDIMTERHEVTSLLQRELIQDEDIFGQRLSGTAAEPGVVMQSMHYLMKSVAGAPLRRPPWFFDVLQQGEGLTDVGTHLVDLVPWMLFPEQPIDHRKDVRMIASRRWPTVMSRADFQRVTGEADFPAYLRSAIKNDKLEYVCNTEVAYALRGVHVKLTILWEYEATTAGGGDTHFATFRGSRATVEIRQGKEENYRPELYVVPREARVLRALQRKMQALQQCYPGIGVADRGGRFQVTVPDRFRVGHEAHFAEVTQQFLGYLQAPETLPAWEKPNMLAKYHVTTQGVGNITRDQR